MIRSIIKLLATLAVVILIYNFFFGTPEEKETSREIFGKGKELVVSVSRLLKSEKDKFDAGKYDTALEKIGHLYDDLRTKAETIDRDYIDRISELDRRRRELERELESTKVDTYDQNPQSPTEETPKQRELKRKLDNLLKDTDKLMQEMEQEN